MAVRPAANSRVSDNSKKAEIPRFLPFLQANSGQFWREQSMILHRFGAEIWRLCPPPVQMVAGRLETKAQRELRYLHP